MASMAAKASCGQVSALTLKEKGSRNKRKFRADPPLSDPTKVVQLPQSDSPGYQFSAEKFKLTQRHGQADTCNMCGITQDHSEALNLDIGLPNSNVLSDYVSSQPKEEVGDEFHDADWSDFTETQLEELVLNNLDTIFKSAIKKIVDCGFSEEVAIKAVLRSGLSYGSRDTVSNIVENALLYLENEQEVDPSKEHSFEDLQQLEKYILAEFISILLEVRPCFSTGDAMWCLLISDMNVSFAYSMDGDPGNNFLIEGTSNVCSSSSAAKTETNDSPMSLSTPIQSAPAVSSVEESEVITGTDAGNLNLSKLKTFLASSAITSETETSHPASVSLGKTFSASATLQTISSEEKVVPSRKGHSSISKRESILRQKSFHVEKTYRIYGSKGASRAAKLGSLGGLILDRKLRDSTASTLKNVSTSTRTRAMGSELSHDHAPHSLQNNPVVTSASSSPSSSSSFTLDSIKDLPLSSLIKDPPKVSTANLLPVLSTVDTELSLALHRKVNSPPVIFGGNPEENNSSYAITPFDKTLGQWVPQDKKDEMIMKLLPQMTELQNQLQEWTEWANQKVMQAARRLSKDKTELKTLRLEKEEVERLKKEKQTLEESTMKKLSEMENALSKASGQVEREYSAVRRLEKENSILRQEMDAAKRRAAESSASCQEMSSREKKTLSKCQSWEKQKSMFQEELTAEKCKLVELRHGLEQAQSHHLQLEALWKQEENSKLNLLTRISSLRKEREQLDAVAKTDEEAIKQKAESNLRRYKNDIQKLEKEISQLRRKTDSSKIAALKRGIDGSYASRIADSKATPTSKQSQLLNIKNECQEYPGPGGVKRERECVMCLSEEMSVVFLPCAHQVVCSMCNELHRKQGMKDCPSCRSPIQRRICVRFTGR